MSDQYSEREDLFQRVEFQLERVNSAKFELEKREEEIATEIERLRKHVRGIVDRKDPIEDFAICFFGCNEWRKRITNLKALQKLIEGKKGELVLVIYRYTIDDPPQPRIMGGLGPCIPPRRHVETRDLYLGRLTSEKLFLDMSRFVAGLVTERHAHKSNFGMVLKLGLICGQGHIYLPE